jgi:glycosyltransferase involved in cell wall biosynthesis
VIGVPVSVIVTAGGSADEFQSLLASLRPALGLRDEAVCVLPPERPDLAAKAQAQSWLTVLAQSAPDQAARWSAGLSATTHPVAVLLDGDILLTSHWLTAVAAAFDDPTVVAAGPRCHRTFGPQRVGLPAEAMATATAFRAYARQWRQDHRGLTDVDRLGPVCVAVRREALERAGGPTLDMPYAKLREQGRLVLVENTLVAHLGGRQCALRIVPPSDAPLLSASLIVKDEEAVIADCLSALHEVADEIVVYDTGSTDRTKVIAREHGARVIDGYWDDHFGDARNRSLAHCRGQWALVVDADEVVSGDVIALRHHLGTTDRTVNGFQLQVDSPTDTGDVSHWITRLFRAGENHYQGRLHEQVTHRINGVSPKFQRTDLIVLKHSGYLLATIAKKDKIRRNRRIAALAKADGPEALYNLARSELEAGDPTAAHEACRSGLDANPRAFIRVALLHFLIRSLVALNRLPAANEALAELREDARLQVTVDETEIIVRCAEGDHERALELLRSMPDTAINDLNIGSGRRSMASYEILMLSAAGRSVDAADLLRSELSAGRLVLRLDTMVKVLESAGSDLTELARLIPRETVRQVLYTIRTVAPAVAEALLEALWVRFPGDPQLLGMGVWLAGRLSLPRAVEWSVRLREEGLAKYCPLLAIAAATDRPARDRALAAAAALEFFGDDAALDPLSEALAQVPDDQTGAVLEELSVLAPGVASAIESV